MKTILLILLSLTTALAGPDLRVLRGDEGFHLPFRGLISGGERGSFSVWEYPIDERACFDLGWLEPFQGVHRFTWMDLAVYNAGDAPFLAGNPWQNPEAFLFNPRCNYGPVLDAFYAVTITHTNGQVLLDRILSAEFMWDCWPISFSSPRVLGFNVGISPGWVAWAPDAYLDVTSVPNGEHILTITIDPLNLWGVFSQESIRIRLDGFDLRYVAPAITQSESPSP